ncbi:hypothetical protein ILYODFUR_030314 [Ilyodon furcidens]|uniref:Uncharacterized protein n=1 Tax=Ilyodon furcidens TaxID=33524 RepID=A0ABV0UBH0_9TELE
MRNIHNHKSLAPLPYASHQHGHTLLWDNNLLLNQHLSQVSQSGCVNPSPMHIMPKMIPEVFSGVEVRTAGRPFHPLFSQSGKLCSVGASIDILEDKSSSP